MRIIEIIVSPKGETRLQTKGYSGAACLDASKWLERSLGVTTEETKTAEFFRPNVIEQQANQ